MMQSAFGVTFGLMIALLGGSAFAEPTLRLGPREAALRIDRRATFEPIWTGDTILVYREDGLEFYFGEPPVSQLLYFGGGEGTTRPYLYAGGCGAQPFLTIRTEDGAPLTNLEMTIGINGPSYARWETYRRGVRTGFGTFFFDPATDVGLRDRETFDAVRIAADTAPIPEGWGVRNCVHLDDVFATVATDEDEDGVLDDEDRCPGSNLADAIDAEGCTLAQVCGEISVETIRGHFMCMMQDWLDDEPTSLFPRDCEVQRAGGSVWACVARERRQRPLSRDTGRRPGLGNRGIGHTSARSHAHPRRLGT